METDKPKRVIRRVATKPDKRGRGRNRGNTNNFKKWWTRGNKSSTENEQLVPTNEQIRNGSNNLVENRQDAAVVQEFANRLLNDSNNQRSNFTIVTKSSVTILKSEDSDIDIEECDIQDVEDTDFKFENSSHNIDEANQPVLQMNGQETDEARLHNNVVNSAPSTSTSSSGWPTSTDMPEAIQNRRNAVTRNALTTITNRVIPNSVGASKEKNNVVNMAELCVLCGKDISKLRNKKLIRNFLEMILSVTGIDVTQYEILLNSCGVCYQLLVTIKKFKKQVIDANILIQQKLSHLMENNITTEDFEFACVDTIDEESEPSPTSDHIGITIESNNIERVHVTKIENDYVTTINQTLVASETATSASIIKNITKSIVNLSETVGSNPNTATPRTTESNISNMQEGNTISYEEKNKSFKIQFFKTSCPVCGKLLRKYTYKKHMVQHEAPLACKVCDKPLKLNSVRRHMQRHENRIQKPKDKFVCSQRGKSYCDIRSLREHEVTHGEKKILMPYL